MAKDVVVKQTIAYSLATFWDHYIFIYIFAINM